MIITLYKILSIFAPIAFSYITYITVGEFQFFPTLMYMVTSPTSKLLYYNMGINIIIVLVKFTLRAFFGTLDPSIIEYTWEKLYMTFIDSLLALTIFRSEITGTVLFLFFLANLFKVFYWITDVIARRLETENTNLKKVRNIFLKSIFFLIFEVVFVILITNHLKRNGISVYLLFLSEFMVLSLSTLSICIRTAFLLLYSTESVGLNSSPTLFYLDVIIDLTRSAFYVVFFLLTMMKYGLPIHLMHDLTVALHSAWNRIKDFNNYRKLNSYFDQRLRNATQEQLENVDRCMICFESMTEGKVLACNHVFHGNCLKRWLENSMECPMCRATVNLDQPLPPQETHQIQTTESQRNTSPEVSSIGINTTVELSDALTPEMDYLQEMIVQVRQMQEFFDNQHAVGPRQQSLTSIGINTDAPHQGDPEYNSPSFSDVQNNSTSSISEKDVSKKEKKIIYPSEASEKTENRVHNFDFGNLDHFQDDTLEGDINQKLDKYLQNARLEKDSMLFLLEQQENQIAILKEENAELKYHFREFLKKYHDIVHSQEEVVNRMMSHIDRFGPVE